MKNIISLLLGSFLVLGNIYAQQIIFDEFVDIEGIRFYKQLKTDNYFYMPLQAKVAQRADGKPLFSLTKLIRNEGATSTNNEFEEGTARGILTASMELRVDEDQVNRAKRRLTRKTGNPKAVVAGAVTPRSGTVTLVSNFNGDVAGKVEKVLGLGKAPVIQGTKSSVSIALTNEGVDEVWATFNTPNPDLTFHFDYEVKGYLAPKSATLNAKWKDLYNNKKFQAALSGSYGAIMGKAEIIKEFEAMRKEGAIKVEYVGDDTQISKLVETAYTQLINIMFDKVGNTGVPSIKNIQENNLLDRVSNGLKETRAAERAYAEKVGKMHKERATHEKTVRDKAQSSRNAALKAQGRTVSSPSSNQESDDVNDSPIAKNNSNASYQLPNIPTIPGVGIGVSYRIKKVEKKGSFFLDFNKYLEDTRVFSFTENIGDMKALCPECFYEEIIDPVNRVVRVNTNINGSNDFSDFISGVTISLRKKHANGQETLRGLIFNEQVLNDSVKAIYSLTYPRLREETNRNEFMEYELKIDWSYYNGIHISTGWIKDNRSLIQLATPLVKKEVSISTEENFFEENEISYIAVNAYYHINGDRYPVIRDQTLKRKSITLKSDMEFQSFYILKEHGVNKSSRDIWEYETISKVGREQKESGLFKMITAEEILIPN